mmetsp:Transcript_11977/g.21789  ORF Transcript_11977/g.21789 Transcript_11977/m.21789 type:complete len:198 (+) Transcript_11977:245-838(+)
MRGNKILHRRIVGDSLLNLLEATSSSSSSSTDIDAALLLLWNGYNLVEQAPECFRNKQYEQAISLYKEGIEMALEPAQALVKSSNNKQNGMLPRQFAWLVRAYCEESEAKLQVNDDKEGALESARAACHLSKNTNAQSLTVLLATACQSINDANGESQALKAYFDLKEDDPNMPRNEANRRRSLGFRLQKLEREASG